MLGGPSQNAVLPSKCNVSSSHIFSNEHGRYQQVVCLLPSPIYIKEVARYMDFVLVSGVEDIAITHDIYLKCFAGIKKGGNACSPLRLVE